MPVATGIWKALQGRPAAAKVSAIHEIAQTLALLIEDEGLNHRDLKLQNLYVSGERFVVGDFGLARRPEDPDLTAEGKVIGPYKYLPSEVFVGDGDPDWERVDVSVLARVLWQLITESERPVRGPIAAGGEYSLTRFSADDYLPRLDGVLAAATHESPSRRPTMAGFATALAEWLSSREERGDLEREVERLDANAFTVLRALLRPCGGTASRRSSYSRTSTSQRRSA